VTSRSDDPDDQDVWSAAGASGPDLGESCPDDEVSEWIVGADGVGQAVTARSSDDRLATQVAQALRCDPLVYGRHLEVMVQNRVTILIGELGSVGARAAAGRQAWTIPGIRDVCNRLAVTSAAAGNG
jgi:hypothetical protein